MGFGRERSSIVDYLVYGLAGVLLLALAFAGLKHRFPGLFSGQEQAPQAAAPAVAPAAAVQGLENDGVHPAVHDAGLVRRRR